MANPNGQTEKATLVLSRETSVWLDQQTAAIRRHSGEAVSRSELVRGILQGLADASMDFSHCTSERDVCKMLSFLLEAFSNRRVCAANTEVRTRTREEK
jgi:hypothetical protein